MDKGKYINLRVRLMPKFGMIVPLEINYNASKASFIESNGITFMMAPGLRNRVMIMESIFDINQQLLGRLPIKSKKSKL